MIHNEPSTLPTLPHFRQITISLSHVHAILSLSSTHDSYWGRGVPDHARYYAGTDVVEYQIAFGALPNHHCLLESLDYVYPKPPYDDSMVNRFRDAGAGAFTYVRACVWIAVCLDG